MNPTILLRFKKYPYFVRAGLIGIVLSIIFLTFQTYYYGIFYSNPSTYLIFIIVLYGLIYGFLIGGFIGSILDFLINKKKAPLMIFSLIIALLVLAVIGWEILTNGIM